MHYAASAPQNLSVLGYHGTSRGGCAGIIVNGFKASSNEYDWLGDGVYFFQDAPKRALDWAQQHHSDASVVRATVDLVDCMDLLDTEWFSFLNQAHDRYVSRIKRLGLELPKQTTGAHRLDRNVINYAVDLQAALGVTIRSVRGAFAEGKSAYPNSSLLDRSHVQIAVRDLSVITAVTDMTATMAKGG